MAFDILVVEDDEGDFLLVERELRRHGMLGRCVRVHREAELRGALTSGGWDCVLADFNVPGMDLSRTLAIAAEIRPGLPVLLVSGSVADAQAVDLLRAGLTDFVLKDRLARLPEAIRRACAEVGDRRALVAAQDALRRSEEDFKAMFDASPSAMVVLDVSSGRVLHANRRASDLYGYGGEEFAALDFRALTHPDDIASSERRNAEMAAGARERFRKRYLRKDGSMFWGESDVVPLHDADGRVTRLLGSTIDVTDQMEAEQRIAVYLGRLESSMQGTLQAVSNMIELRDPYTAGHERRVGRLASDIAAGMGWSAESCRQLVWAGLVHDVGKIAVPVEILSKPSRLTAIEYELIKTHAERGYEILKDVAFPWPVAEIIRQHHERLDGSGYPRGLRGDAIMPEARVLAVADVLESMSSHRPYRPALGLDVALAELEGHRGSLYDAVVVDAALGLVGSGDYRLPD